ncbi:PREDICTED: UDP-glycosyltransferase 76E11-like [Camelina sativa]|uniref:UDP-glycosyltransferase 76E11-like n=1 Tax=Camelina sativa TaxID=90675 RepID=A0ABM1RKX9_CAMSA|nr:PREDICTED: UDP-glycosyltransferase 76E11-like [Camelina sativa]
MEENQGRRRLVLVPVPAQGHISPMTQLAKSLHSKGFTITVIQTKFNHFIPSDDFTDFQFFTIPESLLESALKDHGALRCAKEFKLPTVIFSTTCATAFASRSVFDKLYANNDLADLKQPKGQQDELVPEFHPLRYKDFPVSRFASLESTMELYTNSVDKRTASTVIINTASCLESSSLSFLQKQLEIPVYPIGFVTVKLNESNYLLWKTQFESFLLPQMLLGYIDGSISRPDATRSVTGPAGVTIESNPELAKWVRNDQLVMAWIFGSLSEPALRAVYGMHSAQEVWSALAKKFNRVSTTRKFKL